MTTETTNPSADPTLLSGGTTQGVVTDPADDSTLQGQLTGDRTGPNPNPDDPTPPVDDTEEVEYEGQKYAIPKALKPALMMNADYTRKTQEVAEQRRALEAQQQQLAQQAQSQQEYLQDAAKVVALDDQIKQFEQVDWNALNQQDPVKAQQLWMTYSQLKDSRADVLGQLQQKEQQRALDSQQRLAKQIEESNAVLARDIKGWSPELAGKLRDFAVEKLGFSAQELGQVTDARIVKLLHRAYVGDQLVAKQMGAATQTAVPQVKPVPTVGSNAPAGKDPGRMSTDEWMKHRNEQLRKQRTR